MAGEQEWITTDAAGQLLDVVRGHVAYLARTGWLPTSRRVGREMHVLRSEVDALVEERARWVSYAEAARIIGCSRTTVSRLVHEGHINQRGAGTTALASIGRASVEQVARERKAAAADRAQRPPRPTAGPPDDGREWLAPTAAAKLLGLTESTVRWMARDERIPATRRGTRWWLRRDHVELMANARQARSW